MKNWKQNLFGFIISIACIAYISSQIDILQLKGAISSFIPAYFIFGFFSLILGYFFRILRWSVLLNTSGMSISFLKCISPFMGSIFLNNILPMRTGDIFRAVIFPKFLGIKKVVSSSSVIMERIFDLTTLILFLFVGFYLSNGHKLSEELKFLSLGLLFISLAALVIIFFYSKFIYELIYEYTNQKNHFKSSLKYKFLVVIADSLKSFDSMTRPIILFYVAIISILIWIGEAGVFYALMLGFNLNGGVEIAMIVMSLGTLSTLLPSSPGYIGPFHLAIFAAISMFGFSNLESASYAFLSHLMIWLPTTIFGAILILLNPELFKFKKNL